jgi:hypothetical protein
MGQSIFTPQPTLFAPNAPTFAKAPPLTMKPSWDTVKKCLLPKALKGKIELKDAVGRRRASPALLIMPQNIIETMAVQMAEYPERFDCYIEQKTFALPKSDTRFDVHLHDYSDTESLYRVCAIPVRLNLTAWAETGKTGLYSAESLRANLEKLKTMGFIVKIETSRASVSYSPQGLRQYKSTTQVWVNTEWILWEYTTPQAAAAAPKIALLQEKLDKKNEWNARLSKFSQNDKSTENKGFHPIKPVLMGTNLSTINLSIENTKKKESHILAATPSKVNQQSGFVGKMDDTTGEGNLLRSEPLKMAENVNAEPTNAIEILRELSEFSVNNENKIQNTDNQVVTQNDSEILDENDTAIVENIVENQPIPAPAALNTPAHFGRLPLTSKDYLVYTNPNRQNFARSTQQHHTELVYGMLIKLFNGGADLNKWQKAEIFAQIGCYFTKTAITTLVLTIEMRHKTINTAAKLVAALEYYAEVYDKKYSETHKHIGIFNILNPLFGKIVIEDDQQANQYNNIGLGVYNVGDTVPFIVKSAADLANKQRAEAKYGKEKQAKNAYWAALRSASAIVANTRKACLIAAHKHDAGANTKKTGWEGVTMAQRAAEVRKMCAIAVAEIKKMTVLGEALIAENINKIIEIGKDCRFEMENN